MVTQKDLKDRFGKFGDVEDVELRTRRDDEGEGSTHIQCDILAAMMIISAFDFLNSV